LQTVKHASTVGKPVTYFEALRPDEDIKELPQPLSKKLLLASYDLSFRIAKAGKNHTIGESLLKPAIINTVENVLGKEAAKPFTALPLSATTVKRRVVNISEFLENEIVQKVRASPSFSLQLDESTDVADLSELLVYVRYLYEHKIEENMLFLKPFKTTTTGLDIFEMVNTYFMEKLIDWSKCSSISTDGAPALTGCHSGFVALVRKVCEIVFCYLICV
jgi:zinc finger BED domain-containing protein 5/7/8/9